MTQKLLVPKYETLHASTEENDKEKKNQKCSINCLLRSH